MHSPSRFCIAVSLGILYVAAGGHAVHAQETFNATAQPDGSSPASDETFNSGDKDDGDDEHFAGGEGGDCSGIDRVLHLGRCNPRQLPSYTGCGPYYNNYSYFLKTTLKHYSGNCEVHGDQLWCHQRQAGMCNPDAGGMLEEPLVDSGMRLTRNCEMICDFNVARNHPAPPPPLPPFPKSRQYEPITPVLTEPCTLPPLEQLAQPPDDGDVAVAYYLPPEDGDIAVAQSLAPDDGDIAIALALPTTTTLSGNAAKNGVFTAPPKPTVLQGKATIHGWPTAPANATRLQGYAIKSLRIPATYKPAHPKPKTLSPQTNTKIQLVLSGGASTYSAEVGSDRIYAGFLQGMSAEMQHITGNDRPDFNDPHYHKPRRPPRATPKKPKDQCQIQADQDPVIDDAILQPDKKPTGAGKFIVDMLEKVLKHEEGFGRPHAGAAKFLKFLGPLVSGADFINAYRETLEKIIERDDRIKQAMRNSPGHDLDPYTVGYLAGQDAADAYAYFVKTAFGLAGG